MPSINKKTLGHLAKLARVEIGPQEEEKLLKDLDKILGHLKELETLNTSDVLPVAGGSSLKNVFREDGERERSNEREGVEQFPEEEEGYLKIPPVFE